MCCEIAVLHGSMIVTSLFAFGERYQAAYSRITRGVTKSAGACFVVVAKLTLVLRLSCPARHSITE